MLQREEKLIIFNNLYPIIIKIPMTVISVSLSSDLLTRLDEFVRSSGYSSRSEAIRLAIRETLSHFALSRFQRGQIVATVTVISEREIHSINSHLMELRHEFDEYIFGNMHLHIGSGYCVEIYLLQGLSDTIMDFISKIKTVRGVREVNYTKTPIEN
jgi:CopG family nickel-responsive transcriptional regulator